MDYYGAHKYLKSENVLTCVKNLFSKKNFYGLDSPSWELPNSKVDFSLPRPLTHCARLVLCARLGYLSTLLI